MHGGLFTPRPEDVIRARIAGWCEAVRTRDVERIAAYYAPDILAFDAVSRLRFEGLDAYRRHWRECLASGEGEMVAFLWAEAQRFPLLLRTLLKG